MPKSIRCRTIEKEVTVVKQTLEELIEDNKEYIEWLKKTRGQKAVDKFIQHLKDELARVPPTGTKIKMKLIEEGFEDDPKK